VSGELRILLVSLKIAGFKDNAMIVEFS